jgi:hypothetical protein
MLGWLTAPILYASITISWLTGGPWNETGSARAAYARANGSVAARRACKVFNIIDLKTLIGPVKDHCDQAILDDIRRRHLSTTEDDS